ncbi:MAG TPA: arylamine N-acetyltransferase [Cryptosporangiaceae bacterium]|nr:arylamine N-acetyltransferase [Cryptosporangiaceae bacterium]
MNATAPQVAVAVPTPTAGVGAAVSVSHSEWETHLLDLDAYLARIGYRGDLSPTAATLDALHRAHSAMLPFENLDIVLGRGIALDLAAVQAKLVGGRRGGYCYEHNLLFAAVLDRLGYTVTRLAARIRHSVARPGPRGHMMLCVQAEGVRWLADVGFGAGVEAPVPLLDGATAGSDGWTYQLRLDADGWWWLRAPGTDGPADLYAFTLEPQHRVDYETANHYTSTHPRSPFVGRPLAMRTVGDARHALVGRELATTHPDGTSRRRIVAAGELGEVLHDVFGIVLRRDEIALLG